MSAPEQPLTLRPAVAADLPAIATLISASVRGLQHQYTSDQREAALGSVFTPDTQLVADGTYFVLATADGALVGCGGWSWRRTLFGGDHHHQSRDSGRLDPAADAAKIRAFFVHPSWAHRGLGSRLLGACEQAAVDAGFRRFELAATLDGIAFYRRHSYQPLDELPVPLPSGEELRVLRMEKKVAA